MKYFFVLISCMAVSVAGQSLWINEFHYDNIGTDTLEFVEIVVPQGTVTAAVTLSLYNGNGGTVYGSHSLSTFTQGSTRDGFTIYYKRIPGIQNGPSDGFALDSNGVVIQFLSYEGVVTATEGPANGMTSVDVGVSESNTGTNVGESLQLMGNGTDYSVFTWGGPFPETPGLVNSDGVTDQSLPVELVAFNAHAGDGRITLKWRTASELQNQGFEVWRGMEADGPFSLLDSYTRNPALRGAGTSNRSHDYVFIDAYVLNGVTYYYKLVDVDINGARTEHGPVSATPVAGIDEPGSRAVPEAYALYPNHPNPFNPETSITFDIPSSIAGTVRARLSIYDLLGQKIITLFNRDVDAGRYNVKWDGRNNYGRTVPSGIYIFRLSTPGFVESRRMVLMK